MLCLRKAIPQEMQWWIIYWSSESVLRVENKLAAFIRLSSHASNFIDIFIHTLLITQQQKLEMLCFYFTMRQKPVASSAVYSSQLNKQDRCKDIHQPKWHLWDLSPLVKFASYLPRCNFTIFMELSFVRERIYNCVTCSVIL